MLTEQQGKILVALARQTIELRLGVQPSTRVAEEALQDAALQRRQGVFVTLHKQGALRGCIGSLTASESIVDGVRRHAENAAFHDHRFDPVNSGEVRDLVVEVSVLSEPKPLHYASAEDVLRLLRPGKDGVILRSRSGAGATFLPQVWDQLPEPAQFLGHLCRKAGLAETAWQSGDLEIQTYDVRHFEEPRPGRDDVHP